MNKRNCLVCKIDFVQANDCVDWNYLIFMLKRMGFGVKWLSWMKVVVFTSSMPILVNGSPTEEFNCSRGLRQGDPISPFLFTIVAGGLAGMVRQDVSTCLYNRFKISNDVEYSLLQFADDTLLIWDESISNLCAMKALFRGFEMTSQLTINLSKIKFYGIGIPSFELQASSSFLGCNIEQFPCKFLGITIGGNHI